MDDQDWLAERFETHRSDLRGIAYRMLDSFRDVLGPVARGMPFGVRFIRIVDGVDLGHPGDAAGGRVLFELQPGR